MASSLVESCKQLTKLFFLKKIKVNHEEQILKLRYTVLPYFIGSKLHNA
jgi:hypothetical protein